MAVSSLKYSDKNRLSALEPTEFLGPGDGLAAAGGA
jgi:hypothetical protein